MKIALIIAGIILLVQTVTTVVALCLMQSKIENQLEGKHKKYYEEEKRNEKV